MGFWPLSLSCISSKPVTARPAPPSLPPPTPTPDQGPRRLAGVVREELGPRRSPGSDRLSLPTASLGNHLTSREGQTQGSGGIARPARLPLT